MPAQSSFSVLAMLLISSNGPSQTFVSSAPSAASRIITADFGVSNTAAELTTGISNPHSGDPYLKSSVVAGC
ncbi:hypothetical protein PENSPDRAFT_695393 [Peniophora sp. CONT]|nr:hypothetical protein PENSPDRAFT_695393 [Peniophora sp. CONT]